LKEIIKMERKKQTVLDKAERGNNRAKIKLKNARKTGVEILTKAGKKNVKMM
jgi:hypothetical protein